MFGGYSHLIKYISFQCDFDVGLQSCFHGTFSYFKIQQKRSKNLIFLQAKYFIILLVFVIHVSSYKCMVFAILTFFNALFFQLYPDQIQILLDAFKNPAQTREEGLYFDDKRYKCVRADKNAIYAKFVSRFNPLSPHDALKHPFYIPENTLNFSTTKGFRMKISTRLIY